MIAAAFWALCRWIGFVSLSAAGGVLLVLALHRVIEAWRRIEARRRVEAAREFRMEAARAGRSRSTGSWLVEGTEYHYGSVDELVAATTTEAVR